MPVEGGHPASVAHPLAAWPPPYPAAHDHARYLSRAAGRTFVAAVHCRAGATPCRRISIVPL